MKWKSRMCRWLCGGILCMGLVLQGGFMTSYAAGEWYQFTESSPWKYRDEDGYWAEGWKQIDGADYYFNPVFNEMQDSGIAEKDGYVYEIGADGKAVRTEHTQCSDYYGQPGWLMENGEYCYLRDGRKLCNEWLEQDGERYYFNENGIMMRRRYLLKDGCLYYFGIRGELSKDGVSDIYKGIKYEFDGAGCGRPVAMNSQEALVASATSLWCQETYKVYYDAEGITFLISSDIPQLLEEFRNSWGVSSADECRALIGNLYQMGMDTSDPATKAWHFSRAMSLCELGRLVDWWTREDERSMQLEMAPVIQQSFHSWEEYMDAYMQGYRAWAGSVGNLKISRERSYRRWVNQYAQDRIEWDTPLRRDW